MRFMCAMCQKSNIEMVGPFPIHSCEFLKGSDRVYIGPPPSEEQLRVPKALAAALSVVEKWRQLKNEGENVGEYLCYDLEHLEDSLANL